MTATTTRQQRLITWIERVSGKPCDLSIVEGKMASFNESRLRFRIEQLTGKKFVFGFDPTDDSMAVDKPNTYDWFLSDTDIVMEWTDEDLELATDCDGIDHFHTVNIVTDPYGWTRQTWECENADGDITEYSQISLDFVHELAYIVGGGF